MWEGDIAVPSLNLSTSVNFFYVTDIEPQIEVLVPSPGYVYGPGMERAIVLSVTEKHSPTEPLLGYYIQVSKTPRPSTPAPNSTRFRQDDGFLKGGLERP